MAVSVERGETGSVARVANARERCCVTAKTNLLAGMQMDRMLPRLVALVGCSSLLHILASSAAAVPVGCNISSGYLVSCAGFTGQDLCVRAASVAINHYGSSFGSGLVSLL